MRTLARRLFGLALGGAAVVAVLRRLRSSRFGLRGRTAIVTGGSRGLGLCIAREVARQGASVVLVARG